MRITSQAKFQLRVATAVFTILTIAITGLLMWLTSIYHADFDLTRSGRNSLSDASIAALGKMDKPVQVTAFASATSGQRESIRAFIRGYQKHKADLNLEFVDPSTDPQRVRDAGIQFDGELLIRYGESKETITRLSEEDMTNALTRLGHRGERWLVFLAGHGERSPDRSANFDLSNWAGQLKNRGFSTRALQLGENPQIPANTTAVIIAGPQTHLLKGEVKTLIDYIDNGGNLLWLADPGELFGLQPLAEALGVELQKGIIVDPVSQIITGSASAIVQGDYPKHPITDGINLQTIFPNVAGLDIRDAGIWQATVLLESRESSWLETGGGKGEVTFDKGADIRGPVKMGIALTRKLKDKPEQRIVVVGDGDFLSNAYVLNGGNLDIGVSMVNWLSRDDDYVSIPVRTVVDRNLELSGTETTILAALFMFLLPFGLIGAGVTTWWRRRKL